MITVTEILQYLQITVVPWATGTAYKVGTYVSNSAIVYYCLIEHTSATPFSADLAALKWTTDSPASKAVNYAIDKVNSHCCHDFRQGTYTEEIYPLTTNRLFVKNWPIDPATGKITVLQYLDESNNTWTDIITGAGDTIFNSTYVKNYEVRLLKDYTFDTSKLVKISFDNLMSSYSGLNDVKGNCTELAALYYKESFAPGGGFLGKTSHNVGGQSDSGSSLAFEAKEKLILSNLDLHKNWNI